MKLLILLCAIVLARATSVSENCNGIKVRNSSVLYERKVLISGLSDPSWLAVDYSTNILYFTYGDDTDTCTLAEIDLNDKKFKNITSVQVCGHVAVDSKKSEVYVADSHRIYKYDPKTDTAELYAVNYDGMLINALHFHEYLYYSLFGSRYIHFVKNGTDVIASDVQRMFIDYFVIDKDEDMFYTDDEGVYCQKKGTKNIELFQSTSVGETFLTTDINGEVYAAMTDGIYVVNKNEKRLDRLIEISEYEEIAFDKDNNVIYNNFNNNIYILKPNKNLTC